MTTKTTTSTKSSLCPQCGAIIESDSMFCGECGASITDTPSAEEKASALKLCPMCKTPMEDGAMFCGECGYSDANNKLDFMADTKHEPEKNVHTVEHITETKKCPSCGNLSETTEIFCQKCGCSLLTTKKAPEDIISTTPLLSKKIEKDNNAVSDLPVETVYEISHSAPIEKKYETSGVSSKIKSTLKTRDTVFNEKDIIDKERGKKFFSTPDEL